VVSQKGTENKEGCNQPLSNITMKHPPKHTFSYTSQQHLQESAYPEGSP